MSSQIKFERIVAPVASVEFTYDPRPGNYSRAFNMNQVKEESAGNIPYVYDKGDDTETRTLKFTNLPEADLTNFIVFLNTIRGAAYNFTFTDYDGDIYTARIWNAENILSLPKGLLMEDLTIILRIG